MTCIYHYYEVKLPSNSFSNHQQINAICLLYREFLIRCYRNACFPNQNYIEPFLYFLFSVAMFLYPVPSSCSLGAGNSACLTNKLRSPMKSFNCCCWIKCGWRRKSREIEEKIVYQLPCLYHCHLHRSVYLTVLCL